MLLLKRMRRLPCLEEQKMQMAFALKARGVQKKVLGAGCCFASRTFLLVGNSLGASVWTHCRRLRKRFKTSRVALKRPMRDACALPIRRGLGLQGLQGPHVLALCLQIARRRSRQKKLAAEAALPKPSSSKGAYVD